MSRWRLLGAVLVAGSYMGCATGGVVVVREPVTVVPTRTAGVTFVIVRPASKVQASGVQQPGDGGAVMPESDYVLICDARGMTGMQCAIPAEAALARYSYTPNAAPAPTNIDEGVGTLADVTISRENVANDSASSQPVSAPAPTPAPTPPPVQPQAPIAPTSAPFMAPAPPPSTQAVTQ